MRYGVDKLGVDLQAHGHTLTDNTRRPKLASDKTTTDGAVGDENFFKMTLFSFRLLEMLIQSPVEGSQLVKRCVQL